MTKLFNSKYPIICSSMNQVSDPKLAIAVANAGCVPSLFLSGDARGPVDLNLHNINLLESELAEFRKAVPTSELVLTLSSYLPRNSVVRQRLTDLTQQYKISHYEFIVYGMPGVDNNKTRDSLIKIKNDTGVKFIYKSAGLLEEHKKPKNLLNFLNTMFFADAISIKNSKGAGRVLDASLPLLDSIKLARQVHPSMSVIAAGGISSSTEIKQLIDAGASAVSLGTVFALATESRLSNETKERMIQSSFDRVQLVGPAKQNALLFSDLDKFNGQIVSDDNNTAALAAGVASAESGLVFAGAALDNINQIESVEIIVRRLVADL